MNINVLCPNGRRENIKVSPNTTVLQVVEEVCRKRGFDSSAHDLKYGRTTLDVTTPIRFSGIPNNGKLELVTSKKPRTENTEVTIALQLESGERIQKTVNSNLTLEQMLENFQPEGTQLCAIRVQEEKTLHPVIINVRDRIIGVDLLKHKTLRSVGLISGKAALRLSYQEVPQEQIDNIRLDIEREQAKKAKYEHVHTKTEQTGSVVQQPAEQPAQPTSNRPPVQPGQEKTTPMDTSLQNQNRSTKSDESMENQESTTSTASSSNYPTVQTMDIDGPSEMTTVQPFSVFNDAPFSAPPIPPLQVSQRQQRQYEELMERMRREEEEFKDFKFPDKPAIKPFETTSHQEDNSNTPCDRETVLFNLFKENSGYQEYMDVSDEFFEINKDDLLTMIHDLQKQSRSETPLMTSTMRNQKLEESFSHYKRCVVRFRLPDHIVIQAQFRKRETVQSLYDFIQSTLENPLVPFYLYTTPPRTLLTDKTTTLIHANLVPLSIVYVGSKQPEDLKISSALSENVKLKSEADQQVSACLPQTRKSTVQPSQRRRVTFGQDNSISNISQTSSPSTSGQQKLPKWYKGSGK